MKSLIKKLFYVTVAGLFWLYIWLVALTSRMIYVGKENVEAFRCKNENFIFGFWHYCQFFLCYIERNHDVSVLISSSNDGEYIARIAGLFKINSVRGSTSKGAAKALVQMIRILKSNKVMAITPDGPRGPARTVELGVIHIAQKTERPIIPLNVVCQRKKVFNSWDSFELPLPFNTFIISYGKPVYLNKAESFESGKDKIKKALDENMNLGLSTLSKIRCK